ncbi:hypothetical protein WKI71_14370 [Streptomyces sp. MS1.AVA.1]|uniref:Serine peptidase n=1 Tax=Streptomyces machairae TaxID=3134109 RepID=A0ABU8UJW1_9ACTN
MKILGIHGIGNHRPGESPETAARNLSATWAKHLGADGADVHVVYYADLLREDGAQSGDEELEDLTPAQEELVLELVNAQPADPGPTAPGRVAQGLLTAFLRDRLAALAESRECPEWYMQWFMARLAKEVVAYQTPGSDREEVRRRLREAIDRHHPDVLVAHSLGSVIAYETLHGTGTPHVPLWVTIGSPLALPKVVFDRLDPAPWPAGAPGRTRWDAGPTSPTPAISSPFRPRACRGASAVSRAMTTWSSTRASGSTTRRSTFRRPPSPGCWRPRHE